MKSFLAVVVLLCASMGLAAEKPGPVHGGSLTGKVLEVQQTKNFTYLRLKTRDGETWAATQRADLKKGMDVTLENTVVMTNFQSTTLNRKFDKIVFGQLPGTGTNAPGSRSDLAAVHAGVAKSPAMADVKVAKASGPNARTVAEIVVGKDKLKGQTVLVRGQVVKYNPGILGRNWIHLRDGSGSAADRTNDVLVTSKSATKLGDVVLVKGIVRTNQDFGAGYSYPVMIEAEELSGK